MSADESTHGMEGRTQTIVTPSGEAASVALQASLVVIDGWEIGRRFELDKPEMTIGRGPECDIRLPVSSISRTHARIAHREEDGAPRVGVSDCGSTNGVFVNGQKAAEATLRTGDTLRLGGVALKFVLRDSAEGRFYHELLRRLRYDDLTGLLTRESFRTALEDTFMGSAPGEAHCLAMTDLDGLKAVNDAHGHLAGAMVIREMGAIIRETLRPQDAGGLYGGDEAMLLFTRTQLDGALEVAGQLRQRIERNRFEFEGAVLSVTISQGLAEWPKHGRTNRDLVAAADRALYAAKAAGRNCIRVAEE